MTVSAFLDQVAGVLRQGLPARLWVEATVIAVRPLDARTCNRARRQRPGPRYPGQPAGLPLLRVACRDPAGPRPSARPGPAGRAHDGAADRAGLLAALGPLGSGRRPRARSRDIAPATAAGAGGGGAAARRAVGPSAQDARPTGRHPSRRHPPRRVRQDGRTSAIGSIVGKRPGSWWCGLSRSRSRGGGGGGGGGDGAAAGFIDALGDAARTRIDGTLPDLLLVCAWRGVPGQA